MRARVLLSLVLFGLIAIVAILVPTAEAIAVSRTQELSVQRAGTMREIVRHAATAVDGETDGLRRYLERVYDTYGEAVVVRGTGGETVAEVGELRPTAALEAIALAAARGIPQLDVPTLRPWSADTALIAEGAVVDGASRGVAVMAVDVSAAKGDILRAWALTAAAAVLLLALLLWAAWLYTEWVLRPVRALDAAANALSEKRDLASAGLTGPPELRRLASSFARMAHGMEAAIRQQRGFVADVSHQLRNPLAAVRLRIDAQAQGTAPDDLAAVAADLDRLEGTIARMLALAEAEHRATAETSGRGTAETGAAGTLADALAPPLRRRLEEAAVDVRVEGDGGVRVPCRPSDLAEIVENLVDNARKYAGPEAAVSVRLSASARGVALEVADDGPGLSDADIARAGVRFWRAPAHRSLPGTGLGLAIVSELARANGATVSVARARPRGLLVRVEWRGVR